jgi:hypothetical protein
VPSVLINTLEAGAHRSSHPKQRFGAIRKPLIVKTLASIGVDPYFQNVTGDSNDH